MLYDSREAVSLGAARERALPVAATSSAHVTSSSSAASPVQPPAAPDITGVTTAVRPDEPVTETTPAVDDDTGQVPRIDPE
jgi:hypothetical protein